MTHENLKKICKIRNVQLALGCLWFEGSIIGRITIKSFSEIGVRFAHSTKFIFNCSNELETELDKEIKHIKKIKIERKIQELNHDFNG